MILMRMLIVRIIIIIIIIIIILLLLLLIIIISKTTEIIIKVKEIHFFQSIKYFISIIKNIIMKSNYKMTIKKS